MNLYLHFNRVLCASRRSVDERAASGVSPRLPDK